MNTVEVGAAFGVLLAALAVTAAAVVRLCGLGPAGHVLVAAARAVVQLAAVSVVIAGALTSLGWTTVFLLVMVTAAAGTSSHRVTGTWRPAGWWTTVPIVVAVAPTAAAVYASGVVPLTPIGVLPTAGILIGGAMTATTLAGRRTTEELSLRRGEYEAALSVGLSRRSAVGLVARTAAALALVPGMDQTRTVGLVTLPGAFVGVLLAGGSPLQAGAAQLLVLVALLVVQGAATAVTVELVAGGLLPVDGRPLPQ